MNRAGKIMTGLVAVIVIAVGIGWGGSVYASQEEKKTVTQAAQDYFVAFKEQDIDEIVKHVKDNRAKNESELRAEYEQFIKVAKDQHEDAKFIGVEEVSSGNFQVNFSYKSDMYEKGWVSVSLPMIKENGEWKIFVNGDLVVDTKK